MKQTIEFTDSEILYELREVIKELFENKIESLIDDKANKIIEEEVENKLHPIIEKSLNNEKFIEHHGWRNDYTGEKTIDEIVKQVVSNYLNDRVYLYSRTSDTPSERYAKTSSSNTDNPTRLEMFLIYCIERYIDKNIADKMENITKSFIEQRGDILKVAKEQMQELLRKKFGL
jgi:hypothetical protein